VANPRYASAIRAVKNELASQSGGRTSASMHFTFHEVHSLEELGFKLTGKYDATMAGGTLGLNYGNKKSKYYFVMEFSQTMFSISVDPMDPGAIFTGTGAKPEDYLYISRVNYGRRGFILFESNKSEDELKLNLGAHYNSGAHKASIDSQFNMLKNDKDVKMEIFFYGGSPEGGVASIKRALEDQKPNSITDWLERQPSDYHLAKPIGYEIKNMNNDRLGLNSNFEQTVETCIPKRDFKLKVTLTDIQNIKSREADRKKKDDGR